MTKFFLFFKNIPLFFFLSVLSGILVGTSYIPFNGWALFFCYLPLWYSISSLQLTESPYKKIFLAAWLTQFVLTLIGFNWIYYVATEFGLLHWSLAATSLILFSSLMHIYIPIASIASVFIIRYFKITNLLAQLLILALQFSIWERVWPSIFEWNLAYTLLWINFPLFQWADTIGFLGLSTLIFIFQACLLYSILTYKKNKSAALLTIGIALVTILSLALTGHIKAQTWSSQDSEVHIAVVQGNIGNAEKIQSEKKSAYQSYIRQIYTNLTETHLKQSPADIVIWPETAMPFALNKEFASRPEPIQLLQSVNSWNSYLITGGYSVNTTQYDHLGYPLTANAAFYLQPNNSPPIPPYFKTNLLVFGEYMPLGTYFPILYKWLPFVGIYEVGSGPQIAQLNIKNSLLNIGPQICYESLDPDFSRKLALNGAQVIYNLTNDSWYGKWPEPFQHNIMNLARAVEVRRPLIRATNTGISSAILADGTILQNSPQNEAWAHTYKIGYKMKPEMSFYTLYGHLDWIIWLLFLFVLILSTRKKGTHV